MADAEIPSLDSARLQAIVDGIWQRDPAAFVEPDAAEAAQASIRSRLGWLDAPRAIGEHADRLARFAGDVRSDGFTDVVLLGMGGSSLCAEVLRDVPGPQAGGRRLTVLDTTDERTIRGLTESLDLDRTLFLVASKSGSTIEVSSLERHFWSLATSRRGAAAGRHFAAITDPDTPLEALALDRGYRQTFVNPPDIGGRYSALSLFGLVPAVLLGLDLRALAASATKMADACRASGEANPGLALGVFMAAHSQAGRDKLTVLLPPALASLGSWIEQLVAESTGKHGVGVLPVVGERPGQAREYGPDRAFVVAADGGRLTALGRELAKAGRPVFTLPVSAAGLGGEFFRWEFATAVAGAMIRVNPFDEPNVKEAKTRTAAQLEMRIKTGAFRMDPPFARGDGYSRRAYRPETRPSLGRRRYVALLDFLPANPDRAPLFDTLRAIVRQRTGLATTYGIGPRYLHSTGQFHKGGPNTGIFVLLTATDASATPVPGTAYTFSALKQAQALGDFEALVANGREVVHYHLDDPTADFTVTLERLLAKVGD